MSYRAIGKVKTIVLPVPKKDESLTISQYKERYGIDLNDFFYNNGDFTKIKEGRNKVIYLDFSDYSKSGGQGFDGFEFLIPVVSVYYTGDENIVLAIPQAYVDFQNLEVRYSTGLSINMVSDSIYFYEE